MLPDVQTSPLFTPDGDTYIPAPYTRSPWSTESLHGGAPGALLVGLVERHETDVPMRIVRVSADIVRPVPVRPLTVVLRTVRPGRRVSVVEAVLSAGDDVCMRTTSLLLRDAQIAVPTEVPLPADAPPAPSPSESPAAEIEWPFEAFHSVGCEVRFATGRWMEPGPAFAWIRLRHPVLPDEEPSPVQRMVAAADFSNGVSSVLPFDSWLFVNPDLTVHVHRPAHGEWIGVDATTHLSQLGSGTAVSGLYDVGGRTGWAVQSLLVEPR
ncbi:MAG: hypothetical protein QOG53_1756 [Frankiales bacterium]|jgi:hypothetical protein|nr:hypothetical protein [Frankiales bacterium]